MKNGSGSIVQLNQSSVYFERTEQLLAEHTLSAVQLSVQVPIDFSTKLYSCTSLMANCSHRYALIVGPFSLLRFLGPFMVRSTAHLVTYGIVNDFYIKTYITRLGSLMELFVC